MKCPGCGKEMEDGALYCMECGEEITIVPVYEPDIELTIDEALGTIGKDIHEEQEVRIYLSLAAENRIRKYNAAWTTILTIIGILLVCLGIGVFGVTRFSPDYIWNRGQKLQAMAKYDKAIECYERLFKLQNEDIEVYFRVAECYNALGNLELYQETLREIYAKGNENQVSKAVALLIPVLQEKSRFAEIHDLVLYSGFESVRIKYADYLALPPQFSHDEGFYIEIIPLKFYTESEGQVYVTFDGSVPTLESTVYKNTIFLDEGEHVISAMFVNEYGLASDVVTKTYNIYFEE